MGPALSEIEAEHRELEARMAAWLTKIADYDRSASYNADGFGSTAVALRVACHLDGGVAKRHVDLARTLQHLPAVTDAFSRGEISRAHAAVVADAYTPRRADALDNVESQLADVAREHTPHVFGGIVRRLTDAIDGDDGAATDEHQHERRRLHLSGTFDRMVAVDGLFDLETGEYLKAALSAEMEHDHVAQERRTPAQRHADALLRLVRRGVIRGATATKPPMRRHFVVRVDLADLPGIAPADIDRMRVEARGNGRLSAATLARLSCDAELSRVITAGPSEILDVGRTTRTVSPALWKALVVRDRHCQGPHCDRPPTDCEAHHLRHWAHGGLTNLDNLQLLCWSHHREQHRYDAQARAA